MPIRFRSAIRSRDAGLRRPARFASRRPLFAAALLFALLGASCGKKGGSNPVAPPSATATLTGLVIGSNGGGLPLAGVEVSSTPSAGASATSNSFGTFTLTVPANTAIAITTKHAGFAAHPFPLQLTTNETHSVALVLAAFGATSMVGTAGGGKVTDAGAATAITLPAGFVTGTSTAQVSITGLDPTTDDVLSMPGTFAAENSFGSLLSLDPAAFAEVRIGDGVDQNFPLAQPAVLEMHLPASLQSDPAYLTGASVPCFTYDDASGHWKFFANGSVATSTVDGQKAIRLTVTHLSWFAAGFLRGSNGCVSGVVFNGVAPVSGATVQAYPGGTDVTKADGSYRVTAPPDAVVQILASHPITGSVQIGNATATAGSAASACGTQSISLHGSGPPPTYTISAQLMRGRVAGVPRDQAFAKVFANTSPAPTLLTGSVVEIGDGVTARTLPFSNGSNNVTNLSLVTGATYTLRVDFEPDGVFDASAQVQMPARPVIAAPLQDDLFPPTFTASWTDPASGPGYSVRYVGSMESQSFGTFPSIFTVDSPTSNYTVGTGTGQPALFMPNDPLLAGGYVFRLWATNGPIRYTIGSHVVFAQPNIVLPNATGWFSAIAQADSVTFGSLGDGTRPHTAMRVRR